MRIGFVVNDVATEQPEFTTTRLAMAAIARGHEAWLLGVGDFSHDPDGCVAARARTASGRHRDVTTFLADVQSEDGTQARLEVDELDVLMMRNDPSEDVTDRPWAVTAGVLFGQLAAARGVLVANDPFGLANALNKTYFQHFPESVRPRTLISRDRDVITAFVADVGGHAVLKPLQGSGGAGVFLVSEEESPNFNQIIDAISRDGYVVAQEYLPGAADGDVRIFVLNGEAMQRDGRYAAFRRRNAGADLRSNMHVGGAAEPVEVTDEMLELVRVVRPKLLGDGMFLVGLDVVGTKLMEINVFSPGGLGVVEDLAGIPADEMVVDALEHKVELRHQYGADLGNAQLATL
jgi:glutathione synthase